MTIRWFVAVLSSMLVCTLPYIFWKSFHISQPLQGFTGERGPVLNWSLSLNVKKNSAEWLQLLDEQPLLVQTEWNYFPETPVFKPQASEEHRENFVTCEEHFKRYSFLSFWNKIDLDPQLFVEEEKPQQRWLKYFGYSQALLTSHVSIQGAQAVWMSGKSFTKERCVLPEVLRPTTCAQPVNGIVFVAEGEAFFYWDKSTGNDALDTKLAEFFEQEALRKNAFYSIHIE